MRKMLYLSLFIIVYVASVSVVNDDTTVAGFVIIGLNITNNILQIKVNSTDSTIAGAARPMRMGLHAARQWWNWGADG